jgi:hypothetical protein
MSAILNEAPCQLAGMLTTLDNAESSQLAGQTGAAWTGNPRGQRWVSGSITMVLTPCHERLWVAEFANYDNPIILWPQGGPIALKIGVVLTHIATLHPARWIDFRGQAFDV